MPLVTHDQLGLYLAYSQGRQIDIDDGPVVLDMEETSGGMLDLQFDSGGVTQAGDIYAIDIDLKNDVTPGDDHDLDGIKISTPAFTLTGDTITQTYRCFTIESPGALNVNDTVSGASIFTWDGYYVEMPAITQTAGDMDVYGVRVVGGVVTSGNAWGLHVDMNASTDTALYVAQGYLWMADDEKLVLGSTGVGTTGELLWNSGNYVELLVAGATKLTVTASAFAFYDDVRIRNGHKFAMGSSDDMWWEWDNTNSLLEFWTTDDDGGGTDALIMQFTQTPGALQMMDDRHIIFGSAGSGTDGDLYWANALSRLETAVGGTVMSSITSSLFLLHESTTIKDAKNFSFGNSNDIYFQYDGTNDWLELWSATGPLEILNIHKDDGEIQIFDDIHLSFGDAGAGTDAHIVWNSGGSYLSIFHSNAEQVRIWNGDVQILDNTGLVLGTGNDWKMEHVTATNKITHLATSQAGVTFLVEWDIPIGAGGAAAAPLTYDWMIDGTRLFAVVAETDGAGTYQNPFVHITDEVSLQFGTGKDIYFTYDSTNDWLEVHASGVGQICQFRKAFQALQMMDNGALAFGTDYDLFFDYDAATDCLECYTAALGVTQIFGIGKDDGSFFMYDSRKLGLGDAGPAADGAFYWDGTNILVDHSGATVYKVLTGGIQLQSAKAISSTGSEIELAPASTYGVEINTTGARPGAAAAYRGQFWLERGGVGVADLLYMCLKDNVEGYSWIQICAG